MVTSVSICDMREVLPLMMKLCGHVAVGGAQGSRQRNGRAAIGELEVGFQGQRAAVRRDGVVLFADGLLKLVQAELARFSLRSGLSNKDGGRQDEQQKTGAAKAIHAIGLLDQ